MATDSTPRVPADVAAERQAWAAYREHVKRCPWCGTDRPAHGCSEGQRLNALAVLSTLDHWPAGGEGKLYQG